MNSLAAYEADFSFTFDLLSGFFRQGRVQRALAAISEKRVSGWEKWWQVELVLYASEHEEISEWDMEEPFFTDLRTRPQKNSIAVDLCFRRKRCSRDSMIFLELKQNEDWKSCIENMMRDAEKIYGSHTRSHNNLLMRNFFVAGVYSRFWEAEVSKAEVRKYVMSRSEQLGIDAEIVDSKFIANTPYAFTMF